MLLGFLHRGEIEFWTYAIAADARIQDVEFIRFTSEEVNFDNQTINGEVWNNGEWVRKRTRFPDAIRNFEMRSYNKKTGDHILKTIPYSLGPSVSKFEQTELFSRIPAITALIPQTFAVNDKINIIEKIKAWGMGLLKPVSGRLGKGIIFIKVTDNSFEIEDDGKILNLNESELIEFLSPFYSSDSRPYILQQFAAGTAPNGRYYNVRIVVIKSGDGDWHPCNVPMSLLAPPNSIIANRDAGAKNIDLEPLLKKKFALKADKILDELFSVSVKITRILDDAVNGTAEEIALDLAIDDKGKTWLHEANWRGGVWLFHDDIGLHRHGGANLKRIALQHRAGVNIDYANAIKIAAQARPSILNMHKQKQNWEYEQIDTQAILGLEIARRTDETISLVSQSITQGLPILAVSSITSFRAAQKAVNKGIKSVIDQVPIAKLPWLISFGGACIHDTEDEIPSHQWLVKEFLNTSLIDKQDLDNGYAITAPFLQQVINDNRKDLGVATIDLFIIEGIERSLSNRTDWEERWIAAALVMDDAIFDKKIQQWGFAINEADLNKNAWTSPQKLVKLLSKIDCSLPSSVVIKLQANHDSSSTKFKKIIASFKKLSIRCIFSLAESPLKKKEWHQAHQCIPENLATFLQGISENNIILCPAATTNDLTQIKTILGDHNKHFNKKTKLSLNNNSSWYFLNNNRGKTIVPKVKDINSIESNKLKATQRIKVLSQMARFDHRQYFRFFVDGRFHESYRGWVGYSENEPGSVEGILAAYCHILDNFDLSNGLNSTYIRELHLLCMKNVLTKNLKSMPGELRYLEAGFNIYRKYSTYDSIDEILKIRQGDGTPVFHTKGFEKKAEDFTAEELIEALKENNNLKFRPWYPPLTHKQKRALSKQGALDDYIEVKHIIQRGFAKRLDQIVAKYNEEIESANTTDEVLIAISRVTRNIEMLHPFPDGNGRLCIAILMNHLLLYNGLLPSILDDPNIDIELSVKEFAELIKQGIKNTELLLENPEAKLFNFSINDLTTDEIKTFQELSQELIFRISPYANVDFDETSSQHAHQAIYLYLTPNYLAQVAKGQWINVGKEVINNLRFKSLSYETLNTDNQLLFLRTRENLIKEGIDPVVFINEQQKKGVTAVVVDDIDLARLLSIPALYVKNIDDALRDAARATRRAVSCKAIAIAGEVESLSIKQMFSELLQSQAETHTIIGGDNKTPNIMTSLANLRLTDNLEINEISIDRRPNVARYRSRAISPNICFFPNMNLSETEQDNEIIQAHAAVAEGLQEGGICLVNSDSQNAKELIETIKANQDVSIQTFGKSTDDIAQVIDAKLDTSKQQWQVKANILGKKINYKINGSNTNLPTISTGILLAIELLGYDVKIAAKMLSKK